MIFKGVEICCPHCRGELEENGDGRREELHCQNCKRRFPVLLGIPDLRVFPDPYIDMEADRAKGAHVATRFDELTFSELVDFYYSITPVVPPKHARQYKRGVMAGVPRSEASLSEWEKLVSSNGRPASSLLEVGCGTAPLLVVASRRFNKLVGVDIAFRWLVVAKKRLAEDGLDVPLICACAEALPFPSHSFDRVVLDSTLEHVRDQSTALAECNRVMRPAGYLFVSTPNRYSLGPDPHAGIWAGGVLPRRVVAWHVRRQGGIPPKRHLLSVRSMTRLIQQAGFSPPGVILPTVAAQHSTQFGRGIKLLINLYHVAKRLPISRRFLRWIGPQLCAVAEKPVGRLELDGASEVPLNSHEAARVR
jgi:SAM-dependent methyltransferase